MLTVLFYALRFPPEPLSLIPSRIPWRETLILIKGVE